MINYYQATADLVGTAAGPFNISSSNDQLSVSVDGGSAQVFTLTHGSSVSITTILGNLSSLSGAQATAFGNFLRITTNSALGGSSSILVNAPPNNCNSTVGFTAGTIIGYNRVQTTITVSSKSDISTKLETVLNSAGWTTVSGHGTSNLLMQSGLTPSPQNLQFRVRIRDFATNSSCFNIESVSGTEAQPADGGNNGIFCFPGVSETWNVIANKYQFFFFTPATNVSRKFAFFGCPALPPQLQGVITECFYCHGNAQNDSGSVFPGSFRLGISTEDDGLQFCNQSMILNGNVMYAENNLMNPPSGSSNNYVPSSQRLISTSGSGTQSTNGYLWHDGAAFINDALIAFGITNAADPALVRGYLWDAVIITTNFTADTNIFSMDSHNWWVITSNNTSASLVVTIL